MFFRRKKKPVKSDYRSNYKPSNYVLFVKMLDVKTFKLVTSPSRLVLQAKYQFLKENYSEIEREYPKAFLVNGKLSVRFMMFIFAGKNLENIRSLGKYGMFFFWFLIFLGIQKESTLHLIIRPFNSYNSNFKELYKNGKIYSFRENVRIDVIMKYFDLSLKKIKKLLKKKKKEIKKTGCEIEIRNFSKQFPKEKQFPTTLAVKLNDCLVLKEKVIDKINKVFQIILETENFQFFLDGSWSNDKIIYNNQLLDECNFNFHCSPPPLGKEIYNNDHQYTFYYGGFTGDYVRYMYLRIKHWDYKCHKIFSQNFRKKIFLLMLISNRKKSLLYQLPIELLFIIFTFIEIT